MAWPESDHHVDVPLMPSNTRRKLTLIFAGASVGTALVFAFVFVVMQLTPPTPSLWTNVIVLAIGAVMSGLFGWGAVAVRRTRAHLNGTTLYYSGGYWSRERHADLSMVTTAKVLVKANPYVWDASLRLAGNGTLREFPLAGSAARLPPDSRELLAQALEQNPDAGAVSGVISILRGTDESGPSSNGQRPA